jgi:hypothetical protein
MGTSQQPLQGPPGPVPAAGSPAERAAPAWVSASGWGLILLVIVLLIWQRVATGGHITGRQDWLLLCVGVALVTGVAFWLATPGAQGELSLPKLGIRLAGGAGIGACFMVLAWGLTRETPSTVIVPLEAGSRQHDYPVVIGHDTDNLDLVYLLRPDYRVLVEFKDGRERGWFQTKHLEQGGKFVVLKYKVTRAGLEGKAPSASREGSP